MKIVIKNTFPRVNGGFGVDGITESDASRIRWIVEGTSYQVQIDSMACIFTESFF